MSNQERKERKSILEDHLEGYRDARVGAVVFPETGGGNEMSMMKCPHCGREYSARTCRPLVPTHDYPLLCRSVCPGSGQVPRNAETDMRPLWKDIKEVVG